MAVDKRDKVPTEGSPADVEQVAGGRFSLNRLSAAFARLTSNGQMEASASELADSLDEVEDLSANGALDEVVSPRMIVEGMLFVGTPDGRPLTNREMAAHIRDVSPREVDALVEELNQGYATAQVPYRIVSDGAGYRMEISSQFEAVRRRFSGRVREAKLTPQAIEVLSIIAYRQPVTAEEVGKLRGARSHALLNQLVRRGLLCLERPQPAPHKPTYFTTEKFNRLFGLESPQDLPSSEDLDDT